MKRIILDLDDVLNSFTLHVLKEYGCDVDVFDYHKYPTHIGYDIIRACEFLGGSIPLENGVCVASQFWDNVTRWGLWASAPKSMECDWLINWCAAVVGRENVYIATCPTKDAQAHADKFQWIINNLPKWIHRQYFITPRKWLLAKTGVLLFDDNPLNCDRFEYEGGESVLVPRPWNTNAGKDTGETIIKKIREVIQERAYV